MSIVSNSTISKLISQDFTKLQLERNHSKKIGYQHLVNSSLPKEDMDIDEKDLDFEAFQVQIVQLDENDFFSKTDLVVFKDSYKGLMPLNGIGESEFKECKTLLDKIIENKTNIKIVDERIISDLTLLSTRRCGRKLIEKIAHGPYRVILSYTKEPSGFFIAKNETQYNRIKFIFAKTKPT